MSGGCLGLTLDASRASLSTQDALNVDVEEHGVENPILTRWLALVASNPQVPLNVDSLVGKTMVLQCLDVADVSKTLSQRMNIAYDEAQGYNSSAGGNRCLKLLLSDGVHRVVAIEARPCPQLDQLQYGGKLTLTFPTEPRRPRHRNGMFMMTPERVQLMGGYVPRVQHIHQQRTEDMLRRLSGRTASTARGNIGSNNETGAADSAAPSPPVVAGTTARLPPPSRVIPAPPPPSTTGVGLPMPSLGSPALHVQAAVAAPTDHHTVGGVLSPLISTPLTASSPEGSPSSSTPGSAVSGAPPVRPKRTLITPTTSSGSSGGLPVPVSVQPSGMNPPGPNSGAPQRRSFVAEPSRPPPLTDSTQQFLPPDYPAPAPPPLAPQPMIGQGAVGQHSAPLHSGSGVSNRRSEEHQIIAGPATGSITTPTVGDRLDQLVGSRSTGTGGTLRQAVVHGIVTAVTGMIVVTDDCQSFRLPVLLEDGFTQREALLPSEWIQQRLGMSPTEFLQWQAATMPEAWSPVLDAVGEAVAVLGSKLFTVVAVQNIGAGTDGWELLVTELADLPPGDSLQRNAERLNQLLTIE